MATGRAIQFLRCVSIGMLFFWAAGCYNANDVRTFLQKDRAPVSGTEYRVMPPDVVTISSMRVPEIDGFSGVIRPDGKINLPLLGEVSVAEKTPKEIEKVLTEAAGKYYEEADATVQVAGYNSRKYYVFGEVLAPGPMPWTGCDPLLDVLARARPTDTAWPERIIVIRSTTPSQGGYVAKTSLQYKALGIQDFDEAGGDANAASPVKSNADPNTAVATAAADPNAPAIGAPQTLTVNLLAMVEHGDMANNILLRPNDIVYVQPNPLARFSRALDQVMSPLRTLTDGVDDIRELQTQWKWVEAGFPARGDTRDRIIAR